jgi:hypothetical protein
VFGKFVKVVEFIPLIIQVVDWAEDKFRGPKRGPEKKEWAREEVILRLLKGDVKEFFDFRDMKDVNWLKVAQDPTTADAVGDAIDAIVRLRNTLARHATHDDED